MKRDSHKVEKYDGSIILILYRNLVVVVGIVELLINSVTVYSA